jgi:hypothetical protein
MLISIGRFLVVLAACWAIGASLFVLFSPQTVHVMSATAAPGEPQIVEEFTLEKSWYEVQGLWGTIVLVIFAGLYVAAVRFAWRAAYPALPILSVIALALSYLAGLSIGAFYLPAALALFVGMLLLMLSRRLSRT